MNGGDTGLNAMLVAPEIDQSIETFVSTTTMATGDDAAIVPTFAAMLGNN
jgi:hypothetical protein